MVILLIDLFLVAHNNLKIKTQQEFKINPHNLLFLLKITIKKNHVKLKNNFKILIDQY